MICFPRTCTLNRNNRNTKFAFLNCENCVDGPALSDTEIRCPNGDRKVIPVNFQSQNFRPNPSSIQRKIQRIRWLIRNVSCFFYIFLPFPNLTSTSEPYLRTNQKSNPSHRCWNKARSSKRVPRKGWLTFSYSPVEWTALKRVLKSFLFIYNIYSSKCGFSVAKPGSRPVSSTLTATKIAIGHGWTPK